MTRFKINGKEYTDDSLLVLIPNYYKTEFEGHNFKDRENFSRALMFASCAAEARYYNRPWLVRQNEVELNHQLNQ